MNKETLKKANSIDGCIRSIETVEIAFNNNHWVMFSTPEQNDLIPCKEPLYSELKEFLKMEKEKLQKQFLELE